MTFDWKTLTDGYTLFAGEYHADVHLNFKGEWSWYAFKGAEMIGSGKGLKDSFVSRAAAEKAIRAHQWEMPSKHKPYFDRLRNMFREDEHQGDGILVATAKRNDLGEPVVEVVGITTEWVENDPKCPACGESTNLHYNDQYANGESWSCNECKHEFMHQKSASGGK